MSLRNLILTGLAMCLFAPAGAQAQRTEEESEAPGADARFRQVFATLAKDHRGAALREADSLVAQYPNFRLAHLMRGDLLLARAHRIAGFGGGVHAPRDQLELLRAEAKARMRAAQDLPPPDKVPRYLLQLAAAQKYAIVVDASRSRVFVYENAAGVPRLTGSYYSSLGKRGIEKEREGDQKTPIGVYRVTSKIAGSTLPDLYGWGAFALNYPNEWDRLRGRTGHGIWIHGVPSDTYARAPQASDGCIALANPEIAQLAPHVTAGTTPVVIAKRIEWASHDAWRAERDAFKRALESWRLDWESRDSTRYLAHYARSFRSDGMNLERWSAHKRGVNAGKSWIRISLNHLSVTRDPGAQALMVVSFEQDYRSSNLAQKSRKRQYWILEDGLWKIAYEGAEGRPVLALPESYPVKQGSS